MRKIITLIISALTAAVCSAAVSPSKVFVVANSAVDGSPELARYYCKTRTIPEKNIILIDLPLPKIPAPRGITADDLNGFVARKTYLDKIETPIIQQLVSLGAVEAFPLGGSDNLGRENLLPTRINFDYLVLCKGVPWGISTRAAKAKIINKFSTEESSVDSELSARFLKMKSLKGAVPNPAFKRFGDEWKSYMLLRVARLDAITFSDARKLIDNALYAETNGLRGRAYIDKSHYAKLGDKWLDSAARILISEGFDTTVDNRSAVMDYDTRFDAPAVYFGWYSTAPCRYFAIPAFSCAPAMIGWHIYSFSALSLTDKNFWTPVFAAKNSAATDGNVFEPYLSLTRNVDVFADCVFAKKMLPSEAAFAALPSLSWQNIYIGDPLYNPHKTPLSAQLENIARGKTDAYSQYSLIRNANLIAKTDGNAAAAAYLKQFEGKLPDTALVWKIAELSPARENILRAAKLLFDRKIFNDPQYVGLAFEIAAALQKHSEPRLALNYCESIISNDTLAFAHPLAAKRAEAAAQKASLDVSPKTRKILNKIAAEEIKKLEAKMKKSAQSKTSNVPKNPPESATKKP